MDEGAGGDAGGGDEGEVVRGELGCHKAAGCFVGCYFCGSLDEGFGLFGEVRVEGVHFFWMWLLRGFGITGLESCWELVAGCV